MESAPYSGAATGAVWGAFMLLDSSWKTLPNIGETTGIVLVLAGQKQRQETRTGSEE
jgi:hypothetical protein